MTQISNLVANDPSSAWDRVSRRQCWMGAKNLGLNVKPGAKHGEMVGLFISQGIKPEQIVNFAPVVKKTPNGDKVEMYPVTKQRVYDEGKEHRRMEEFEKRIDAATKAEAIRAKTEKDKLEARKNAEISELKTELDELKAMMKQLLDVPRETQKTTDPLKMKFMAQRKWLKEHGVALNKGDDAKALIIQVLEQGNGENAS